MFSLRESGDADTRFLARFLSLLEPIGVQCALQVEPFFIDSYDGPNVDHLGKATQHTDGARDRCRRSSAGVFISSLGHCMCMKCWKKAGKAACASEHDVRVEPISALRALAGMRYTRSLGMLAMRGTPMYYPVTANRTLANELHAIRLRTMNPKNSINKDLFVEYAVKVEEVLPTMFENMTTFYKPIDLQEAFRAWNAHPPQPPCY